MTLVANRLKLEALGSLTYREYVQMYFFRSFLSLQRYRKITKFVIFL